MELEIKYLHTRDAVFRLIDQFAHEVENEQEELCFHNLCESALEKAFTVLDIKEDIITKAEFYKLWDANNARLKELGESIPEYHHYEWYMEEKDEQLQKFRNRFAWFMEDDDK